MCGAPKTHKAHLQAHYIKQGCSEKWTMTQQGSCPTCTTGKQLYKLHTNNPVITDASVRKAYCWPATGGRACARTWTRWSHTVPRATKYNRPLDAWDQISAPYQSKDYLNNNNNNKRPLTPKKGLFYRWGIDLFGPLPRTANDNTYVVVMVEHYSKQIKVVAVPNKEPATIKRVFLDRVISQYGCCAEVISDNGGEYKKEFCELLAQLFIDHRNASANHPQANGLAERTVQTMKRAIRKWTDTHAVDCHWDDALPYILLGYRCSVQAATGLCPYEILHGCKPIVPPAIMERMSEPNNFDDADKAAAQLIERMQLLEEHCIIAGHNLAIAQHRDTLRFAQVRTGAYAHNYSISS